MSGVWRPLQAVLKTLLWLLWLVPPLAHAGELIMASSSSSPPYIIPAQDRGIAVDLIRAAFAPAGLDVRFVYAPNFRVEHELESRRVDGVYTVPNDPDRNYYVSAPLLYYRNIAVSLAARDLHIDRIADLRGLRIATFQNATRYLGAEFAEAVRNSNDYHEVSNQLSQVAMLYNGRVDVIILEQRIFDYFRQQLGPQSQGTEVRIHRLFAPASRHAGFASETMRDLFDRGLSTIQANGDYDAILNRYTEETLSPSTNTAPAP